MRLPPLTWRWCSHDVPKDKGNSRIQELTPSGTYVAEWFGPTTAPLGEAMAMDAKGNVYISFGDLVLTTCLRPKGCSEEARAPPRRNAGRPPRGFRLRHRLLRQLV